MRKKRANNHSPSATQRRGKGKREEHLSFTRDNRSYANRQQIRIHAISYEVLAGKSPEAVIDKRDNNFARERIKTSGKNKRIR